MMLNQIEVVLLKLYNLAKMFPEYRLGLTWMIAQLTALPNPDEYLDVRLDENPFECEVFKGE